MVPGLPLYSFPRRE